MHDITSGHPALSPALSVTCVRHPAHHGPSNSASTRNVLTMYAFLWRLPYATNWAFHYKRMPCPTLILLSVIQVLKTSSSYNILLEMSVNNPFMPVNDPFPNPFCNWPKHMYVNNDENGPLRCLVEDCPRTFTDKPPTETPLKHYMDGQVDPLLSDISRNEHGLMKQLHTLGLCLFCGPTQPPRVIRSVLYHTSEAHMGEPDLSTIPGFLVWVRRFPHNFPEHTTGEKAYRAETFKLAYEHLKLKLTTTYWPEFRAVMGYANDPPVSDAEFRRSLTDQYEVGEHWPCHPNSLLLDLTYDSNKMWITKEKWDDELYKFQELYRKGEI